MLNTPVLINWSLTNRCNLGCKFCFMLDDKEINFDEKNHILKSIIDSGVKRVTLTGGEPTLVDEFEYIIDELASNGIFCSVHTNGTLPDKIKKKYEKIDRVSLSLDGPNKEVNAFMRGKDCYFETILDLISFLKNKNKNFTIKTLASKKNIQFIPEMAPLIDEFSPEFWSIAQFRPIRIGAINQKDYEISDRKFSELLSNLKGKTKINSLSLSEASSYPIFLISANGNAYTNDTIKGDICMGSVLDNDIKSIWKKIVLKNSIKEKYREKYSTITSTLH